MKIKRRFILLLGLSVVFATGIFLLFRTIILGVGSNINVFEILPQQTYCVIHVENLSSLDKFFKKFASEVIYGLFEQRDNLEKFKRAIGQTKKLKGLNNADIYIIFYEHFGTDRIAVLLDVKRKISKELLTSILHSVSQALEMNLNNSTENSNYLLISSKDSIYVEVKKNLLLFVKYAEEIKLFDFKKQTDEIKCNVKYLHNINNKNNNELLLNIQLFNFSKYAQQKFFDENFLVNKNICFPDTATIQFFLEHDSILHFRFFLYYLHCRNFMTISNDYNIKIFKILEPQWFFLQKIVVTPIIHHFLEVGLDTLWYKVFINPEVLQRDVSKAIICRINDLNASNKISRLIADTIQCILLKQKHNIYTLKSTYVDLLLEYFDAKEHSKIYLMTFDTIALISDNLKAISNLAIHINNNLDAVNSTDFTILNFFRGYPYFLKHIKPNKLSFFHLAFEYFHFVDKLFFQREKNDLLITIHLNKNALRSYFSTITRQYVQLVLKTIYQINDICSFIDEHVNQKPEGRHILWTPDSLYFATGSIRNGVMDGIWRFYDCSGKQLMFLEYKKGIADGQCIVYIHDPLQRIFMSCSMVKNKIEGNVFLFHPNGRLAFWVNMKDGMPHGVARIYYPSGTLMTEVQTKDFDVITALNVFGDIIIDEQIYKPMVILKNFEMIWDRYQGN